MGIVTLNAVRVHRNPPVSSSPPFVVTLQTDLLLASQQLLGEVRAVGIVTLSAILAGRLMDEPSGEDAFVAFDTGGCRHRRIAVRVMAPFTPAFFKGGVQDRAGEDSGVARGTWSLDSIGQYQVVTVGGMGVVTTDTVGPQFYTAVLSSFPIVVALKT